MARRETARANALQDTCDLNTGGRDKRIPSLQPLHNTPPSRPRRPVSTPSICALRSTHASNGREGPSRSSGSQTCKSAAALLRSRWRALAVTSHQQSSFDHYSEGFALGDNPVVTFHNDERLNEMHAAVLELFPSGIVILRVFKLAS